MQNGRKGLTIRVMYGTYTVLEKTFDEHNSDHGDCEICRVLFLVKSRICGKIGYKLKIGHNFGRESLLCQLYFFIVSSKSFIHNKFRTRRRGAIVLLLAWLHFIKPSRRLLWLSGDLTSRKSSLTSRYCALLSLTCIRALETNRWILSIVAPCLSFTRTA